MRFIGFRFYRVHRAEGLESVGLRIYDLRLYRVLGL